MPKYQEFDLGRIRRLSVRSRETKVTVDDFARPLRSDTLLDYLDALPRILCGNDLRHLVELIHRARERGKPVIWGFGGHVIKVGLAPVLIDLMNNGYVSALATNGSGSIHDFEIALSGSTSEDVERELGDGSFGMAEETGKLMNQAIRQGVREGLGIGAALGSFMENLDLKHPDVSLLLHAYRQRCPLTVHLAIGTDTIHGHPEASGEALGAATHSDFRVFVEQVSRMHDGGVYLNVGSAVMLPEIFLKAVSIVRSAGEPLGDFVTANFDFIQHYRPTENVVRRPVKDSGRGFAFTGHHELMIPLLAGLLLHTGGTGAS